MARNKTVRTGPRRLKMPGGSLLRMGYQQSAARVVGCMAIAAALAIMTGSVDTGLVAGTMVATLFGPR